MALLNINFRFAIIMSPLRSDLASLKVAVQFDGHKQTDYVNI